MGTVAAEAEGLPARRRNEADLLSRPAPKAPGHGDRSVPLAAVVRKIPAFRLQYGITRVADTTYLDRIGIATMSAFVPRSADVLGVYSGKGRSRDEALVSTVMEAVERQVSAAYAPLAVSRLPRDLQSDFDLVDVGYSGPSDRALRCVSGCNLLTGKRIDVPLGLVNPFAESEQFPHWTSNGLASGSSLVEALYHALFEVVERHRWSVAEIVAHVWPRFLRATFGDVSDGPQAAAGSDDDPAAAEVMLPTGDSDIDELVTRIRSAGVQLRLFAFADELWPVATFACLTEAGAELPMVHSGMSCSWSPKRAAIAAIVEAASSRAIAIQGAREDLMRAHEPRTGTFRHGRRPERVPSGRWFYDVPAPGVRFSDLTDRASGDLAVDVTCLLDVIRVFGIRCVAMVDLSPPDGSVYVVRVVAPGLERFTLDGSTTARTKRLLTMPFSV